MIKRSINCFLIILHIIILTCSFSVDAIDFDAETSFDSVVVIISGNSLGSGFALGEDCIITNSHVINGNNTVSITMYEGSSTSAYVIYNDKELDIAVLYCPSVKLSPLKIGELSNTRIGSDVYAIGAPHGMSYTLTKGTLSSKKRDINGVSYLQIDAALNEGNSGGPLLDEKGYLIGMNTMKMNESEGIGLAIPIDSIVLYLKKQGISVDSQGNVDIPPSQEKEFDENEENDTYGKDPADYGQSKSVSERTQENSVIMIVLCISIICNIIMILIIVLLTEKCRQYRKEKRKIMDFDIEFLE